MIRYRYANLTPPAPFVSLAVGDPVTNKWLVDLPAQIDTAADRSVLPDQFVSALGLTQEGQLSCLGFAGQVVQLPTYVVQLSIHNFPPVVVKVVLGRGEPYIILGRDVLNNYRILLDGPQQALEIDLLGPPTP